MTQAGFKPWFLDVDPQTWMLDPTTVMKLSPDARREIAAVIPVCAFGATAGLSRWRAFREATGIPVLIDAAAAFDALDDARLPAVVSLHATKVAGIGEAESRDPGAQAVRLPLGPGSALRAVRDDGNYKLLNVL